MQVFLSGFFIALIIILTPNLLPSPDNAWVYYSIYLKRLLLSEELRSYNVYEV